MKKSFPILFSLLAFFAVPFKAFAIDLTAIQGKVSDYLPYVLIGGAVILLISIIGILLSKKKDVNVQAEPVTIAQPVTPQVTTTEEVKASEAEEPTSTVNMDTISNNLYSPAPESTSERPSIQETLEATTPQTFPTQNTQSSDLQAILQGEAASPMTPVTEQAPSTIPVSKQYTQTVDEPISSPVQEHSPIPPIDTNSTPVPDLQQFINKQIAEVPPMTSPTMETPTPTDTTTPTQAETPVSNI
jgi:hypothetical protein